MTTAKSKGFQFVTPPPAQLYALTEPDEEDIWDKLRAFGSGVKYIFILTLMLWWLPVVGQCVAGYIGGRRAGSSYRGFLAAMVPVLTFMFLSLLMNGTPLPNENPVVSLAGQAGGSVSSALPFLVPYLNFSALYLGDFIGALHQTALLEFTMYTVVIVFAFIGGLMADQAKREFRSLLKAVSPVHVRNNNSSWSKYYSKSSGPSFDNLQAMPGKTGKGKKGKSTGSSAKKSNSTTKAKAKAKAV